MSAKAIETHYKGYRFRSRLEARWAVFFDVQGIAWQYEFEGFEFQNGIRYLPDFWLPDVHLWAEVKAEEFTGIETVKAKLLSKHTGSPVLKLIGIPDYREYALIDARPPAPLNGVYTHEGNATYCVARTKWYERESRFPSYFCFDEDHFKEMIPEYECAVNAARSARFEFGESGKSQ